MASVLEGDADDVAVEMEADVTSGVVDEVADKVSRGGRFGRGRTVEGSRICQVGRYEWVVVVWGQKRGKGLGKTPIRKFEGRKWIKKAKSVFNL